MKKILSVLAISAVVFSCTNKQNEAAIQQAKQQSIDSMNNAALVKQQTVDSMNRIKRAAVANEKAKTDRYEYLSDNTVAENNTNTTTTTQKKGMSRTAKGALIGAGVGAVTGAVVSKKKGKGAIIGGLIGAGAGAVTGNVIDRKKKSN